MWLYYKHPSNTFLAHVRSCTLMREATRSFETSVCINSPAQKTAFLDLVTVWIEAFVVLDPDPVWSYGRAEEKDEMPQVRQYAGRDSSSAPARIKV
jgi:hypothetical protein